MSSGHVALNRRYMRVGHDNMIAIDAHAMFDASTLSMPIHVTDRRHRQVQSERSGACRHRLLANMWQWPSTPNVVRPRVIIDRWHWYVVVAHVMTESIRVSMTKRSIDKSEFSSFCRSVGRSSHAIAPHVERDQWRLYPIHCRMHVASNAECNTIHHGVDIDRELATIPIDNTR